MQAGFFLLECRRDYSRVEHESDRERELLSQLSQLSDGPPSCWEECILVPLN